MRYLSLFSGIEAASCAWQPLGWELAGVCEIEKFPCNVLRHHYPDVPNLGDITQVGKKQLDALGPIDLIVGGSPCQNFSTAGNQEGLKGEQSKLAIDYLRVINTVKPKWIVWENVPGVFSTGKGMDFKLFTAALTHFRYGICWRVLDAQWFGVGQRRRRVFLVGYLGDWRPAYKVLFESQSLPGYFETLERTKERLTASAKRSSGKTGTNCLNPWAEQSRRVLTTDGKSDCIAGGHKVFSPGGAILESPENICYDTNQEDKTVFLERQFFGAHVGKASTLTRDIYRDPPAVVENKTIGLNDTGKMCYEIKENGEGLTLTARQYKDPPIVLDDQGGRVMNVSDDGKSPCLSASADAGGNTISLVMDKATCYDMSHPIDVIRTCDDGKTPTLEARMGTGGNQIPLVTAETYRICSYHSNSMKSDNPNSGIYKTETANTLDASDPTPACQQGGIAVCVQGSMIGRKIENGPQGSGINIDKCFTLNTTDRHAVCSHARVRKLTPTECLRLQGFPDDWFEGVEGYSDTAAYKAIGNSMAVPCMRWIGERIDIVEKE